MIDLILDFALYSLPVVAFFLAAFLMEGAVIAVQRLRGRS